MKSFVGLKFKKKKYVSATKIY